MIAVVLGSRLGFLRIGRELAVAVAIVIPVAAQAASPGKPGPAPASQRTARAAVSEQAPEYPHPTDIPPELLRPRKPQAMILPSVPAESPEGIVSEPRSGGAIAEVTPSERLLPEGYVLARRAARFGRDQSWWSMAIGEAGGLPVAPPLRVLPNRRLMLFERVLADGKPEDTYFVTGRVTEFLGHNYVLLEQVVAPPQHPPPAPAPAQVPAPAPAPAPGPGPGPGPAAGTRSPGPSEAPTTRPTRPPTANELIEQLMQEAPARSVTPLTTAPAQTSADAAERSGEGDRRVLPEGTVVPEFPARLVRSEPWWTLTRESQGSRPAGAAYYVLPNRLLEVMVSASAGGTRSVVFLVSGELTEYRGANYLLVHKVLIRRDLGNLR
jgi:hypothetical protein